MYRSRPARTRDTRLTEDEVIETALRLVEAEGTDRLSMRRLADELSVTPMAIYHYVKSKEELLLRVSASVLAQIGREDSGTWQERIHGRALRTWEVLAQYPGLGAFLLDRPVAEVTAGGPNHVMELLREAGFDPETADLAYGTYHTYIYGLLAMEARFRPSRRSPEARRRLVEFGMRTWLAGLEVQLADPDRA